MSNCPRCGAPGRKRWARDAAFGFWACVGALAALELARGALRLALLLHVRGLWLHALGVYLIVGAAWILIAKLAFWRQGKAFTLLQAVMAGLGWPALLWEFGKRSVRH